MLFNSLAFLLFLPVVFTIYWSLSRRNISYQNTLLLVASYVFYGWWDYRFLSLIFLSSLVDYLIGIGLEREDRARRRRLLLAISLCLNLGLLGVFKYYNFFVQSMAELLSEFGLQPNLGSLNVILPVGISFYTFQTLSYSLDIYRRKIRATHDPIAFFAFVSFFPQLVAGPIERAKNLLPQFLKRRQFDLEQAKDGLRQMLWGMLKKVVIADNVAVHVNSIWDNYTAMDSATLFLGTALFAIQIYCDFSGYSDIAIGIARLFGFQLMRNFAFPYFSRDIAEFWRRWHISLSTWFRDYVYFPLGGSRTTTGRCVRNVIITFVVSGLWHGANWTFLIWGLLHGLYYVALMLCGWQKRYRDDPATGRLLPSVRELLSMGTTFCLVCFAWIFFRAESLSEAFDYIGKFASGPFMSDTYWHGQHVGPVLMSGALILIEWFQRHKQHALDIRGLPVVVRWGMYLSATLIVLILGNFGEIDFIYFQF